MRGRPASPRMLHSPLEETCLYMHKHAHTSTHTRTYSFCFCIPQVWQTIGGAPLRHKIRLLTLLKRTRSGRLEATGPAAAAATAGPTTTAAAAWEWIEAGAGAGAGAEAESEAECKSQSPFRSRHTGCFCGAHSKCGNCKLQKIYFKEATNNNNNNTRNSNNNENHNNNYRARN